LGINLFQSSKLSYLYQQLVCGFGSGQYSTLRGRSQPREQFYLCGQRSRDSCGVEITGLAVLILIAPRACPDCGRSGNCRPRIGNRNLPKYQANILGGVILAHALHDQRTFQLAQPYWADVGPHCCCSYCWLPRWDVPQAAEYISTLMVLLVGSVVINETNSLAPVLTMAADRSHRFGQLRNVPDAHAQLPPRASRRGARSSWTLLGCGFRRRSCRNDRCVDQLSIL